MSEWSDEVVLLQTTIANLKTEIRATTTSRSCVELETKLQFNGEPFFLDYLSKVAKTRAAYLDASKLLHEKMGFCYGILFPARLHLTHNGVAQDFVNPDKALAYIKKYFAPSSA